MKKLYIKSKASKSIEINTVKNEHEYIIRIKIKLKYGLICDFVKTYFLRLIFYFSIIFILILIFLLHLLKTKFFLNLFFGGKIYYKNEKKLNLNKIKKQIKNYKQIKINFDNNDDLMKRDKPKISLIFLLI